MEEENSAHGAPWGSIARHPTGFRRLTPGVLKVDRTAEGDTLARVSQPAMHLEGRLAELDINPLTVLPSSQGVK